MGTSATDYSSKYAPNINQSKDLSLKTGVSDTQLTSLLAKLGELMRDSMSNSGMGREISNLRNENREMRESAGDMFSGRNRGGSSRYDDSRGYRNNDEGGRSGRSDREYRNDDEAGRSGRGARSESFTFNYERTETSPRSGSDRKIDREADSGYSVDDKQNDRLAALEEKLNGGSKPSANGSSKNNSAVDSDQNSRLAALEKKLTKQDKSDSAGSADAPDRNFVYNQDDTYAPATKMIDSQMKNIYRTEKETGLPTTSKDKDKTRSGVDSGYDKIQNKSLDEIESKLSKLGFMPKFNTLSTGDMAQDRRIDSLTQGLEAYAHSVDKTKTAHDIKQDEKISGLLKKLNDNLAKDGAKVI